MPSWLIEQLCFVFCFFFVFYVFIILICPQKEKGGLVVEVVVNVGGYCQPQTSTSSKGQRLCGDQGWGEQQELITAATTSRSSRNYCCDSFAGGGGGC